MVYFEKSQPAPNSLAIEKTKKSGKYNNKDVMDRLKQDFCSKCYICEYKSTSIVVEHFKPHKNNIDLKFDWDNLFLACNHCNSAKGDKFGNILNCTIKTDCVDTAISYNFIPFPKEKLQFIPQNTNKKTHHTVLLLDRVFNQDFTATKSIESVNLRDKLLDNIYDFQKLLIDYYENENKEYFLEQIKSQLNKSSEFTAFKRQIIRNSEYYKRDFEKYIKD